MIDAPSPSVPSSRLHDAGSFRARLDDACAAASSGGTPLSLLAIGLDGPEHPSGDADSALMDAVAGAVLGVVRGTDHVIRHDDSGAAFAVLLDGAGLVAAVAVAERALAAIRAVAVESGGGTLRVGASAGLASTEEGVGCSADLLSRAVAALGAARRAGGNRVSLVEGAPSGG
jgi:GGDEF domain-containing protein